MDKDAQILVLRREIVGLKQSLLTVSGALLRAQERELRAEIELLNRDESVSSQTATDQNVDQIK